ncbi:efflux RND transporter periplasmic adaptor subunit [Microbulbifer yueqingensis]|uniref:RND family efflux transporter, MFP subunit n=1 Tax=Microbulbifer yueqingensis TaxID=658219 RepID=A0A1G9CM01_9GAMM|nr:efflux RND transporter periplasmic adaptor subunit [Microbulbifer yueqingensis]SDK52720.1 RND family efflux transporter, MFP subunit [Microbulbifer yueqingensis]
MTTVSLRRTSRLALPAMLVAALAGFPLTAASEDRAVAVATDEARLREIAPRQWSAGRVVSRRDLTVSSEQDGALEFVAEPGTLVRAGDSLAQLDATRWRLELRASESRVRRLQARLKYMDAQLARLQKLSEANNTSRAALEEQQAEREAVHQDLVAARVQRDRTAYELDRTTLVAPFDALVVSREQQAGEYVRTGAPLLRIIDMSQLEVEAEIPMRALPLLRDDNVVSLRSDAMPQAGSEQDDAPRHGKVRALVPVAEAGSRRVKLMVSLPPSAAAEWHWIPGMPVQVAVPLSAAEKVVAVPRDALVLRDGSAYVFRVSAESTAERLPVSTGSGDGTWIAVRGDVAAGDRVVVRGAEGLQSGQKVKVLPAVAGKGRGAAEAS